MVPQEINQFMKRYKALKVKDPNGGDSMVKMVKGETPKRGWGFEVLRPPARWWSLESKADRSVAVFQRLGQARLSEMLCDDSLKASAALQDFLGLQAPELLGKNSETLLRDISTADALMAPFMVHFNLYDPRQCLTRASQAVSWNILDSTCFDSRFL